MIKFLIIGDVVGRYGRRTLSLSLERARSMYNPDVVMLNGENLAGGFGITKKIYYQLIDDFKIDCITMGNHWLDKKDILNFIDKTDNLILPLNMKNIPNKSYGYKILKTKGKNYAVINLCGKSFMKEQIDDPFCAVEDVLNQLPSDIKMILVDMHAETTSEKQAMGHFLSGRASVVYGTHSHVPTSDERILNKTTGFITDIGLTGAYDSIIGMKTSKVLKRYLTGEKTKLEPAKKDPWFCALLAEIDPLSGYCTKIKRILWKLGEIGLL